MEVNDYSGRVRNIQNEYQRYSNELRENYDKNIKDREQVHQNVQDKTRNKFAEEKEKLELENYNTSDRMSKETKESIAKQQEDYLNRVQKEKESFDKDRVVLKEKISKEMDELSKSYKDSIEQSNAHSKHKERTLKDNFSKRFDENREFAENKIADISKEASEQIYENKRKNAKEKNELVKSFQNEKKRIESGNTTHSDLAGVKEGYFSTANDIKKNNLADLKRVEDNSEARIKRQNEAFMDDKRKTELATESMNSEGTNKNQSYLRNLKKDFVTKDMDKQKEFDQTFANTRINNDIEKKNIKDSFDIELNHENKTHRMDKENIVKNLQARMKGERGNYENVIQEMNKRNENEFRAQGESFGAEKRDMIRSFDNERLKMVNDSSQQQAVIDKKHQNEVDEIRSARDLESQMLKDNYRAQLDGAIRGKDEQNKNLKEEFEGMTNALVDRNKAQTKRNSEAQAEDMKSMKREFARDLSSNKRTLENVIYGGTKDDSLRTNTDNVEKKYLSQMEHLKQQMNDNDFKHQSQMESASNNMKEILLNVNHDHNEALDKVQSNNSKNVSDLFTKSNDEKHKLTSDFRKNLNETNLMSEDSMRNERSNNKMKQNNDRIHFGTMINSMTEKNMSALNDVKDTFVNDKRKFIEQTDKEVSKNNTELRDQFRKKNGELVDKYEMITSDKTRENERIKDMYENRILSMEKKFQKEIEDRNQLEEDRKLEDRRATKLTMDTREKEFKNTLQIMQNDFDKKIGRIKSNNDLHVSKLTQKYEDQISRMSVDHEKETKRKMAEARGQYERLAKESQLQVDALRNQYEIRMDKMRLENQNPEGSSEA